LRLKVEINTREIEAYAGPWNVAYRVDNPWFTAEAAVGTFSREEMLATKLRALLQRNKGRDLIDLAHGLSVFDDLDLDGVIDLFQRYLERSALVIPRAEAERRMFVELGHPSLLADIRPLLAADEAERLDDARMRAAFASVFTRFIARLPGDPWARSSELAERNGIDLAAVDSS
jgi:hypothetical protein